MELRFVAMSEDQAKWLAYQWEYEGAYAFYHTDVEKLGLHAFIVVGKSSARQYAVYKDEDMVGFLGIKPKKDVAEIGLGMKPDYIGKGFGRSFLQNCLSFIKNNFEEITAAKLFVAADNKRAIHVSEECGFEKRSPHKREIKGDVYDFIEMEYRFNHE